MIRFLPTSARLLSVFLLPALAMGQSASRVEPVLGIPTTPPVFVNQPGQLELRGVLNARPLQVRDAAKYGLTDSQAIERHARAQDLLSAYTLSKYVPETDESLIEVGLGNEQAVAKALMAAGDFQYVIPDWLCYPVSNCTSDTMLPNQWHHNAGLMNSCSAWALGTGDPGTVVAVCDTGVRTTHLDLRLNRQEGYNGADNLWESQGGQINDVNGHGTATTGCAAANGNNGTGISGSAWNLGHRMMRVTNLASGGATMSNVTQAARTAADAGDKVCSVSYSGVTSPTIQSTGTYIRSRGALLVWAAGNDGMSLAGNRDDSVIVVGATTSIDSHSSFSNFGPFVDLVAPGSSVYTTMSDGDSAYASVSGTSFACPLVAGLCGLIYSQDPSLTPQEVEGILRSGCDDLGSSGIDNTYGYGRVDSFNSLSLVYPCDVQNFCVSVPNSSGAAATMFHGGSASVSVNDLTLDVFSCPPNVFGLFFFGGTQTQVLSGDGILCVSGHLSRLQVTQTNNLGLADQALDLGALPHGAPAILPGDSTQFSFWFRDIAGGPVGWNFADGLSVTWCN